MSWATGQGVGRSSESEKAGQDMQRYATEHAYIAFNTHGLTLPAILPDSQPRAKYLEIDARLKSVILLRAGDASSAASRRSSERGERNTDIRDKSSVWHAFRPLVRPARVRTADHSSHATSSLPYHGVRVHTRSLRVLHTYS